MNSRSLNLFMAKVARQRGILPASVYLGHIDSFDRRPVCGGGFSDIYMGEYNQQLVALKVLRMFGEDNASILQVTQQLSLPSKVFQHFTRNRNFSKRFLSGVVSPTNTSSLSTE